MTPCMLNNKSTGGSINLATYKMNDDKMNDDILPNKLGLKDLGAI